MAAATTKRESELYPIVAKWAAKQFRCFKTEINFGLAYSRGDVLCVRDVGGDLSGEVETIAIEVTRGAEPFATASGQVNLPMISETPGRCGSGSLAAQRGAFSRSH